MASIIFNFFKRVLIVPAAVLLLTLGAVTVLFPRLASAPVTASAAELDISAYHLREYNSFAELEEDDFVGTLSGEDFGFAQTAVLCRAGTNSGVSLLAQSAEPWNGGGLILTGKNTAKQFRKLNDAKKGDTLEFSFYSNDTYQYKITKIVPNVREDALASYYKEKLLVMCVPYNDFSNLGESYFYTVYLAKQV